MRYTTELDTTDQSKVCASSSKSAIATPTSSDFSDAVKLDPDNILPDKTRSQFKSLLQKYDSVFDPAFNGYNGMVGSFKANVNMGPVQPSQRKGRVPQYSRDKLV